MSEKIYFGIFAGNTVYEIKDQVSTSSTNVNTVYQALEDFLALSNKCKENDSKENHHEF